MNNKLISKNFSDSVLKKFPDVIVTSDREPENKTLKYFSVSFIDNKQFQMINPAQISEILSLATGIYIRNYGGLGGMKTISLLGGTPSQTNIMLDGIPLNSIQNGMLDLSVVPSSLINSIEVSRGGASALFGGNSITGSVNLKTINNSDK